MHSIQSQVGKAKCVQEISVQKLCKQSWHLTEENVIFALFSCSAVVSNETKQKLLISCAQCRIRGARGGGGTEPLLEINSGEFEIIRALKFGEDLFFRDHLIPEKKGEVFWFEHSGRFIAPPNCFALLRVCGAKPTLRQSYRFFFKKYAFLCIFRSKFLHKNFLNG